MTGKEALLYAFDRLFDTAARRLRLQCSAEDKEEAKKQFEARFSAVLEGVNQLKLKELPEEAIASMEKGINELSAADLAGMLASVPIVHQAHEMLRFIAFRAAEQRLLEHYIASADDRYGGS